MNNLDGDEITNTLVPSSIRRCTVNSDIHSLCAVSLDELDWSHWFTDGSHGELYLHVYGLDDSIQRVYCRHSKTPRLSFTDGKLYWVID